MRIWKFCLQLTDFQGVPMPEGATVLHVAIQGGQIMLWAKVDPSRPLDPRPFAIVGTGHPAPSDERASYIGTVAEGPFVWHVFELDAA